MNVFLSHINEEAQLALVLKQWIESSLDRDIHLSGEAEGEQRLAELDQALSQAQLVLILCSERSVSRPWINFESGCAWVKRVPVIAVCHLPPPLGNFPALELSDAISCEALLKTLANRFQKKRIPRINYVQMVAELEAAMGPGEVAEPAAMPPSVVPPPPMPPTAGPKPAPALKVSAAA
ncbi:MAG: TIR domain-containing protein, partial [Planctomycetota bacterium]